MLETAVQRKLADVSFTSYSRLVMCKLNNWHIIVLDITGQVGLTRCVFPYVKVKGHYAVA